MTIDKAIDELSDTYVGTSDPALADFRIALRMSIDALKKIKSWRALFPNPTATLLKGETTEETAASHET